MNAPRVPEARNMNLVDLYRSHKTPIHALASAKFLAGRLEEHALVLVSSVDLYS
jgi:hypothetical protein